MSFIVQDQDIKRVQKMLAGVPKGADKAIANALNKSARTAVTGVIKGIRKNYVITSPNARKYGTYIRRAKPGKLEAKINIKGKVLALSYFKASQNSSGVMAQVKKGGGGKITSAFMQEMPSTGHVGVFKRYKNKNMKNKQPRPKKRGVGMTKGVRAIEEFYGPSASYMAKNPQIHAQITIDVQKTFGDDIQKQVANILSKNV